MKKIFILAAIPIAVFLLSGMTHAAKFRVNNSGVNATYTIPQTAHDAASAGDTLYIESSPIPYDGYLYLSKRLVVIGTGYFLTENDSTQANEAACVIAHVSFNAGSANSIMTGVTVSGGIVVDDDNVLIKRVRMLDVLVISANNIVVTQSVVKNISFSEYAVNFQLMNSIVSGIFDMGGTNTSVMKNNIFALPNGSWHSVYNTSYQNNIIEHSIGFAAHNSIVLKNICSGTQCDTTGGNMQNVDMTTVFKYTGSTDGRYKLKAGSLAIGYGVGGVDCGIYGGPEPYVLSGMPTVPAVWLLNVSGTNVSVKAKSH